MAWVIDNWEILTAGLLILIRFIESGIATKSWNIWKLIKEFATLR